MILILKIQNVTIPRSAEIVHSITNVVDNAFKFASSTININLISEEDNIIIEVADDGPGFAPEIFPFLGEPYIKNNNKAKKQGSWLRFIHFKKPTCKVPR